jgi:aspartate racemase
MKIAGVIGGMGPGTSADFYKDVNALAEQQGRETRPELFLWNVPLNYAVEQELLTHQRGIEKYTPHLIDGAKKLERAGADFIAVPCNTVHELYDQFSAEVEIPVLHIVGEIVNHLKGRDIGSVALLATGQTIGSKLYQNFLDEAGIDYEIPSETDQTRLDNIVAGLVTAEGAATSGTGSENAWLNAMVDDYASRTGAVVLGCTDFHIMLNNPDPEKIVDSMHILAEATVANIYES